MPRFRNLLDQRFGRLVAVAFEKKAKDGRAIWRCKCDCGKETVVRVSDLTANKVVSCGCFHSEQTASMNATHGMTGTRVYAIWATMIQRCTNPNDASYSRYGLRGITVCDHWLCFDNFYLDMGDPPDGMSIERIKNHLGYSPGNCKWATAREQSRNTRRNRAIEFNGRAMCVTDWANEVGLSQQTLSRRLDDGWSVERALTTPTKDGALVEV